MTHTRSMAEPNEYDAIAEAYRESKQLSFRVTVEGYTLERLWGDVTGLKVLDLACGEGHYTRILKNDGAADVTGVDISAEMIQLALAQEVANPIGCRYVRRDVANYDAEPDHDLVVGAYLLNYASTTEQLQAFCRTAFKALRPGGRFVGFNDNVRRDPNVAPSFERYGFKKSCPSPPAPGDEIIYDIQRADGTWFPVVNFYLTPAAYAEAFAAAGFVDFKWEGPWLNPAEADNPHWQDFMEHEPLAGFSARRPD